MKVGQGFPFHYREARCAIPNFAAARVKLRSGDSEKGEQIVKFSCCIMSRSHRSMRNLPSNHMALQLLHSPHKQINDGLNWKGV